MRKRRKRRRGHSLAVDRNELRDVFFLSFYLPVTPTLATWPASAQCAGNVVIERLRDRVVVSLCGMELVTSSLCIVLQWRGPFQGTSRRGMPKLSLR